MSEIVNQIEKITSQINNLKNIYQENNYQELIREYIHCKKDLKDLYSYFEINVIEDGLMPEEEFIINFSSFLNYILKGSQSILLEVPKDLFNCSSPFHIKKLLEQTAILTCRKNGYTEIFVLNFSINSSDFQKVYKKILYSPFKTNFTYNLNITYLDGKKLFNVISDYVEDNYTHSLNVKCK